MIHDILTALIATDEHLNVRQVAMLARIATLPRDNCTVRNLAALLGVQKPAISKIADRLDALGLARRMADSSDGRSVLIVPTAKGRTLIAPLLALGGVTQVKEAA